MLMQGMPDRYAEDVDFGRLLHTGSSTTKHEMADRGLAEYWSLAKDSTKVCYHFIFICGAFANII